MTFTLIIEMLGKQFAFTYNLENFKWEFFEKFKFYGKNQQNLLLKRFP